MSSAQQIRFCTASDGVCLAYALSGDGPPLVKAANWLTHVQREWQSPVWQHWLRALARDHTLVRYDGDLADVFAVQDEIAERTVAALRGVLTEADQHALQTPPAAEVQAYDLYLRGRARLHAATLVALREARHLFQQAVDLDPGYAPAHAALVCTLYILYLWYGHTDLDLRQAERSSRKAAELRPDLAESHIARGLVFGLNDDYEAAKAELETALRLNPHLYEAAYFYARLCFSHGDLDRAADLFERSAALDPHEYQATALLAQVYRARGDATAAAAQSRRALALQPDDPCTLYNVACAYATAGLLDDSLDCLEEAVRVGKLNTDWLVHDPDMDPLRGLARFQAIMAPATPRTEAPE